MQQKTKWVWQSLIICVFFNAILGVAFYWPLHEGMATLDKYVKPVISNQEIKEKLPEEVSLLMSNLGKLLETINQYGYVTLFAVIGLVTIAMWITLVFVGRARIKAASEEAGKEMPVKPVKSEEKVDKDEDIKEIPDLSAHQFIALMQREGRFVDFLQEDISPYDDAQIGAAVRTLHDEWRKIFNEHVVLKPIYEQPEGTEVTIEEGFDADAIRLTGRVVGKPPFKGVVKHRGWRLVKIDLPRFTDFKKGEKGEFVVAPAEIEIQGSEGDN